MKSVKSKSKISQEIRRCALLTQLWEYASNMSITDLENLLSIMEQEEPLKRSYKDIPKIDERY